MEYCKYGHELNEENLLFEPSRPKIKLCRKCKARANSQQISRKKNLGTYTSFKRRYRLRELGWTPELWNSAWSSQEGKCANPNCKKVLNLNKAQNEARACADHEHIIPPRPRGILCSTCNLMLGHAKDNVELLRGGILYLEKYQVLSEKSEEDVK